MKVLEDLKYNKAHEWLKVEGKQVTFGITDYAQDMLGDIVYVDLPEEDDVFKAEEAFVTIESVKAATDVLSPFACKVLEVNEALDDAPEDINSQPYQAWIVKFELEGDEDFTGFMDAEAYKKFCEEEA